MRSQAIQDRSHAVFAHAKLQIAACITPATTRRTLQIAHRHFGALKIAGFFQFGIRGRIQISRAADQAG